MVRPSLPLHFLLPSRSHPLLHLPAHRSFYKQIVKLLTSNNYNYERYSTQQTLDFVECSHAQLFKQAWWPSLNRALQALWVNKERNSLKIRHQEWTEWGTDSQPSRTLRRSIGTTSPMVWQAYSHRFRLPLPTAQLSSFRPWSNQQPTHKRRSCRLAYPNHQSPQWLNDSGYGNRPKLDWMALRQPLRPTHPRTWQVRSLLDSCQL